MPPTGCHDIPSGESSQRGARDQQRQEVPPSQGLHIHAISNAISNTHTYAISSAISNTHTHMLSVARL